MFWKLELETNVDLKLNKIKCPQKYCPQETILIYPVFVLSMEVHLGQAASLVMAMDAIPKPPASPVALWNSFLWIALFLEFSPKMTMVLEFSPTFPN